MYNQINIITLYQLNYPTVRGIVRIYHWQCIQNQRQITRFRTPIVIFNHSTVGGVKLRERRNRFYPRQKSMNPVAMSTTEENQQLENHITKVPESPAMPPADARLRLFFLEQARMLCPHTRVNCSEYSKMHAVYKRLKRMDRLFSLLYTHDWGEIFPDLQRAFGFYLLEGYTSKKDRPRIIDLMAKEISFATEIARYNDFIIILMEYYRSQAFEMERMLNLYYRPETAEAFPENNTI